MHIIVDATTTQDEFAFHGIGQYTKNIVLALLRKYPEVNFSILLFEKKGSTLDDFLKDFSNCKVVHIGKYRSNNFLNDIWFLFQFLPAIQRERKKGSIYFCPYFWRNFPILFLPTVLFVHDMNFPRFNIYSQQNKFFNFIRKIQYWKVMYKAYLCKYVLCNSNATKKDFLKYFRWYKEKKVVVSHLGVDMKKIETDISVLLPADYWDKKYWIYLGGGINKSKNSEGVVRSYFEFLRVLKEKRQMDFEEAPYLVIAGKAFTDTKRHEVLELLDLIDRLGIRQKVVFTGFYEDEQRYSLLKESIAFIHLSLYEGFGISVVEAMRSKIPVIVHESDIYKEVVGKGGIFVDGEKPKQVGQVLFQVYIAENLTEDLAEKGYEKSLQYSWDRTAEISYSVFEKLCGE